MDLDDDELKATRKLNGANKANTIKDINILEEFINCYKNNPQIMIQEEKFKVIKAIENLLKERKADKELLEIADNRIKELINSKIGVDLTYDDHIPKSLVKQKFEEKINQLMEICNNTKDVVEKEISRGIAIVVITLKNELLEKKMEENKDEH